MSQLKSVPIIDSHCHLNRIDLAEFQNNLDLVVNQARASGVARFLCVSVELSDYPVLCQLAERYPDVYISVGVHPDSEFTNEPSAADLIQLAGHKSCIAIGETGLDYFRIENEEGRLKQRLRFREHIHAAIATSKPLIIHTRQASEDTLKLLAEGNAQLIGGVMHCFTEDWDVARRALDLNFYISFSGIVTFKNATILHEVAKKVPIDRMLIETDAPYLAPVPYRGKQNHPALVKHVAEGLAALRQVDYETIAAHTTENFYRCFGISPCQH